MKSSVSVFIVALAFAAPIRVESAVTVTTSQGEEYDLQVLYSSGDLLHGLIPEVLEGDRGWHDVNVDPADQLPAFTDGEGLRATGLTGLLQDFPPVGEPTKRILYSLPAPVDISEIRVFSGNGGRDGRVFHTYTVRFSSDGGHSYAAPIYVQSHPSGTINDQGWYVVLTQLAGNEGLIASKVDRIHFDFYGVDNTMKEMRDPFAGINLFTGVDDQYTAPNTSSMIWEIDVLGKFSVPTLKVNLVPTGLALSWVTGLTNSVVIQSSATLDSWSAVDPQPQIQVNGSQYSTIITNSSSPRFYRLLLTN